MARHSISTAVDIIRQRTSATEYIVYKWLKIMENKGEIDVQPDILNQKRRLISDEDIEKIVTFLNSQKS